MSSPRNDFVKNYRVHPMHWLISTQALVRAPLDALPPRGAGRGPPTLTSACFIVVASCVEVNQCVGCTR